MLRAEFEHVLGGSRWADLPPLPLDRLRKELHTLPDDQRPSALCLSAASAEWLHRVGQSSGSVGGATATGAARALGSDPVAPLRAFSNCLSPTGGLSGDAFSLVAIFVRNLLLNALVWVSLLATVVAAPRLCIAALAVPSRVHSAGLWPYATVVLAWVAIVAGVAYIVAD